MPTNREISILLAVSHNTLKSRLVNAMENRYRLKIAANLEKGLAMAYSSIPDIIIIQSDLPQDRPLATCNALKDNQITSHIPIILISNGPPPEDEAAFYPADAALAFSFTKKELMIAIQNVLSLKIQLMQRYPIFYNSDNPFAREQAYLSQFMEQLPKK